MQAFVETLKAWQLHPAVDHFTVALIIVGILVDLVASLFPLRIWIRTTALTLLVLGTAAAWGSELTGGWEAGRVWDDVTGPALEVLKRHAWLGDRLPWVFLALALWRFGIQFAGFLARSRPIYLIIAVTAAGAIMYQGHLGGKLVFDYGVGTALMMPTGSPAESAQPEPTATPAEASPIPTVFNPNPSPTPLLVPALPATAVPSASPSAAESPTPIASPTPVATSLAPGGTLVNPPDGGEASPAASSAESPAPKDL
jgi:uncharacterized membrane protein